MSLNRAEIILDNQLREMGTSLQEACRLAGVPVDEDEFDVNTPLAVAAYERIVEEAAEKLDADLDRVTDPFWSSMSIERPIFTYERLFRGVR